MILYFEALHKYVIYVYFNYFVNEVINCLVSELLSGGSSIIRPRWITFNNTDVKLC